MKNSVKKIIVYLTCFIMMFTGHTLFSQTNIPLNDSNICYEGVYYPKISPTSVIFDRHLTSMKDNWQSGIAGDWIHQWVITQTGIRIRFKTASPNIYLEFTKREGGGSVGPEPSSGFEVFVNGVSSQVFSTLAFTIVNPTPDTAATFEVVLPNLWAVNFTGMALNDGYSLEFPGELNQPVYVAIGNSITHGTGQYFSSAKTYPFKLARAKGWNLYNLAVAGAGLGWAIALNTKEKKVDIISILIGFNDWKYGTTTLSSHKIMYGRLIDSLRSYHPDASIYCISPLTTTETEHSAPFSLEQFREMVAQVVGKKQLSDGKLCFIDGPSISSASMLAPGDNVHLSEWGAQELAKKLTLATEKCNAAPLSINNVQKEDEVGQLVNSGENSFKFRPGETGVFEIRLISSAGVVLHNQKHNFLKDELVDLNSEITFPKNGIYILQIKRGEKIKCLKIPYLSKYNCTN